MQLESPFKGSSSAAGQVDDDTFQTGSYRSSIQSQNVENEVKLSVLVPGIKGNDQGKRGGVHGRLWTPRTPVGSAYTTFHM